MRPVNRDAAHICRLYRCPGKIYRQRRRQREGKGKGQGAAAEAAPVPVSVPDAGGDKRCRRLTFCHPNLPQSLPLPLPSTRGSREKGEERGVGSASLCYVQSHSRLMLCHKIARLNPRYGDKKCLSSPSLSLPSRFSAFSLCCDFFFCIFFRFFLRWVCLTYGQRRREERRGGGRG